jgi:hypothetical protein
MAATTTLSPEFVEAFREETELRYCVGNSHALIVHQYSLTSARCACESTLTLLENGRWVHKGVEGRGVACPPYDCACGQRHNARSA